MLAGAAGHRADRPWPRRILRSALSVLEWVCRYNGAVAGIDWTGSSMLAGRASREEGSQDRLGGGAGGWESQREVERGGGDRHLVRGSPLPRDALLVSWSKIDVVGRHRGCGCPVP